MKVMIIGSGGREHAIALKIKESDKVSEIICVPGNPGISEIAKCVELDIMNNELMVNFAKENNIDYTIVGPEVPLVNGIVDVFESEGLEIFGPKKEGANFEASKEFTKDFMKKYNIPTGDYASFTNFDLCKNYIEEKGAPIVIKADGLAAGKGVCVAHSLEEAIKFTKECFNGKFGNAGVKVVIEEFLDGEEGSFLFFTDGKSFKPMVYSQDHKAIYENDKGPNTGGMGAYSPAPILEGLDKELEKKFVIPFLEGIKKENIDFRGVLYMGLMKTKTGIKVLEFNCRFGDPETQVILPRLETDLIDVMKATSQKKLNELDVKWNNDFVVTVVLASKGYPNKYEKGKEIKIGEIIDKNVFIIHAGTKIIKNKLVTNGGRVINVVAKADTLKKALDKAYLAINKINFEGMYFRKDIGWRAI